MEWGLVHLQALVVTPGLAGSTRVEDVAAPSPTSAEVLVRVLEVGVCGTDREIDHGLFGIAPGGEERLVIGHELLGVVERDAHGYTRGDLVAATVRRSCGHCLACAESSPDSCLTGDYFERGITRLHGFARELVAEDAGQLVRIPPSLGRLGVLAEPTSVCARALRHARAIGNRQPWQLRRALVLGGGAVGTLMTFLLRLEGIDVWTVSLEPANELVEAARAHYVGLTEGPLSELGRFDLVVEAAGNAQLMADSLALLGRSGILCLLGIDGREQTVSMEGRALALDAILENHVLFGSVNARHEDWVAGVTALAAARSRWPDALEALVRLRVPLDGYAEAFAVRGGKATLLVSD